MTIDDDVLATCWASISKRPLGPGAKDHRTPSAEVHMAGVTCRSDPDVQPDATKPKSPATTTLGGIHRTSSRPASAAPSRRRPRRSRTAEHRSSCRHRAGRSSFRRRRRSQHMRHGDQDRIAVSMRARTRIRPTPRSETDSAPIPRARRPATAAWTGSPTATWAQKRTRRGPARVTRQSAASKTPIVYG